MWDKQKAIETVKYVITGLDDAVLRTGIGLPDPAETVLAVIYAADKLHLSRYGRTITGDTYRVGRRSVVPEQTARIIYYDEAPAEFTIYRLGRVEVRQPVDQMQFSRTDEECLNETLDRCRGKTADEIAELAQDEIYRNAPGFPLTVELADIAATLPNAPAVLEHLDYLHKSGYTVSLADIAATLPNAPAVLALLRREGYIPA